MSMINNDMPKISQIATTTLPIVGNEVVVINQGGSTFTAILSSLSVGSGDALTANPLSQFAATTSSQLAGVISDETGTGALVFANSPTFVTPALGTPSSGTLTNCTGLPSTGIVNFAADVAATSAVAANTAKETNANHTGDVTGAAALTIANDAVTNAKAANMATQTIKGRTTAGAGDPEDLTAAQVRTMLGAFAATPNTLVLRGANGEAVFGDAGNAFGGNGVAGYTNQGTGVYGFSVSGTGLLGISDSGNHANFGNGLVIIANNGDTTFIGNVYAPNLATLTGSDTLTNKTLTNPTVNNYTEGVVAIGTVVSAHTISLTSGTIQTATLTASTACAFTMPTATAGKSFILYLKQAAATGNGTATFGTAGPTVKWAGGTAPTITATAGKMDILSFVADGSHWYGSIIQNYTP